jgi:Lrp/AsnC family leucine-responsive transcriptional regulator
METLPDEVDSRLLIALSRDGRRPAADLAKELGLSRQSVTERIKALEARGVIRGYRADIDPAALGLGIRAHLRISLNCVIGPAAEQEMIGRLRQSPLVRSVHRVSGEDCFMVDLVCRRLDDVAGLLRELTATRAVQSSRTAFVLESLVDKTGFGPLDPAWLPVVAEEKTA